MMIRASLAERVRRSGPVPTACLVAIAGALFLASCTSAQPSITGQTVAIASDASALYIAEPDEGAITAVHLPDNRATRIPVDGEPTRIARAGRRLFVTLRASRALAVFTESGSTLVLDKRVDVGAEPYGVAVRADGTRVYVASSLSGTVDELDGTTFKVLRTFNVDDEPRWLAIHPDGQSLYVGSALKGTFTHIDLGSGRTRKLAIPPAPGSEGLSVRITGDLAASPDGRSIAVPVLFVDNVSTVSEVASTVTVGPVAQPTGGYTMNVGPDGMPTPGRFRPGVVVVPIDGNGGLPQMQAAKPLQTALSDTHGYVAGVAFSPDSALLAAAVEGSTRVIVLLLDKPLNVDQKLVADLFDPANQAATFEGFRVRPSASLVLGAGPRGVAFADNNRLYAFSFIDRNLAGVVLGNAARSWVDIGDQLKAESSVQLGPTGLSEQIDRGRRLFYAANDSRMSAPGAGVSCATCHFDGRTDGLTWHFERGPRQTPSLAGPISMTEPVRWEGDRPTVADDAFETSQGPMGGRDLARDDAQAIQVFIDSRRDVDVPLKGSMDPAVLRGKALFERADVGCAGCHHGPRMTDNAIHPMFGLDPVKTRSLVGIAASPPYLHDGSAPTLRAVLDRAKNREMGDTSSLSDGELADLETYLRSL